MIWGWFLFVHVFLWLIFLPLALFHFFYAYIFFSHVDEIIASHLTIENFTSFFLRLIASSLIFAAFYNKNVPVEKSKLETAVQHKILVAMMILLLITDAFLTARKLLCDDKFRVGLNISNPVNPVNPV